MTRKHNHPSWFLCYWSLGDAPEDPRYVLHRVVLAGYNMAWWKRTL